MNEFSAQFRLDPDVRFLNHGSFGACPSEVLAVQSELREELEREPVQFMIREYQERVDAVREQLAPFIGAAPADIVPVRNATAAVNSILRSLEFAPGDEILFTNHGYNACNNAARFVAERSGAKVAVAEIPFPIASPEEATAAILECIGPKTRLALIDHITSPTGLVLPIAEIVSALRERGVETLVDGAHGVGMQELKLDELGAGYYTSNAHKWLCAPKGAAFLHVRRDLQNAVRPAVISHGANALPGERSRFLLEFDWCGTEDPTPWLSIPAAMRCMGSMLPGGWSALRERNRELALAGRALLCEALEIPVPAPDSMIGSLASVPLPPGDMREADAFTLDPLHVLLYAEHKIEVPISGWPAPPARVLRISAQIYNELSDYEALATVLKG